VRSGGPNGPKSRAIGRARQASGGRRPAGARIPADADGLPRRLAARKPPRQDRSKTTVETILEAAIDLLGTKGYARTSTNRIAARAGVSVGSLYQYFPHKDAIVAAIFERHAQGIERVVTEAMIDLRREDVPVREAIRRMLEAFRALHDADPRLARAVDPDLDGRRQIADVVRRREQRFRDELAHVLASRSDVRRGNPAVMASLLYEIVEAVTSAIMHGDARRFDFDEALAEAIEAICRYIEKAPSA
jgi:AcrR family transcriptional regulator